MEPSDPIRGLIIHKLLVASVFPFMPMAAPFKGQGDLSEAKKYLMKHGSDSEVRG